MRKSALVRYVDNWARALVCQDRSSTAGVFAVTLAALLGACNSDPPPPGRASRPELQASVEARSAGRPPPSASVGAAASALAQIRETSLKLRPLTLPSQMLAIGKGRLAQLTEHELIVRALPDWRIVAREAIKGPRAVVALVDGSFLALGFENTHRLQPHTTKFERWPRVSAFPGSLLIADRTDPQQFFLMHGFASSLYHYRVDSPDAGALETLRFFEFPGFDQRGFGALRDGSFLYTAGDGLFRFFAGGRKTKVSAPASVRNVWRILPAKRLDQTWLASDDSRLLLSQLAGSTLRIVDALTLKPTAHDLDVDEDMLAVVRSEEAKNQPRRWFLSVIDTKGREKLGTELPNEASQSQGDDWVKLVSRNKNVVLSSHESVVAVGGPSSLSLWDLKSTRPIVLP